MTNDVQHAVTQLRFHCKHYGRRAYVYLARLLADTLLVLKAALGCSLALPLAPLLVLRYHAADHSTVAQSSFCLALLYHFIDICFGWSFLVGLYYLEPFLIHVTVRVPGL
jgi:hypothetical protein